MIAEYDGKLASAAGDKKVLSRANVEQYLSEFGLDSGQKVKLVLAAGCYTLFLSCLLLGMLSSKLQYKSLWFFHVAYRFVFPMQRHAAVFCSSEHLSKVRAKFLPGAAP
jgi:hypothetical protein